MMHAYHINNEYHHHHNHASTSEHLSGSHVFQLENVSVTIENEVYRKHKLFPKAIENKVITDCNLSFHAGETLFLIGESGSGKSMIVNMLTGTLPQDAKVEGNVWFSGKKVSDIDLKKVAQKNITFIPQSLKALDPLVKYKYDDSEFYPHQMSGGMCRSSLIEDSIKHGASIVIADEPTEGLDEEKSSKIIEKLITLKTEQGCLVVITHDINLALKYADRIAVFKGGTILEETSVDAFNKGILKSSYAKKMHECLPSRIAFEKPQIRSDYEILIDNVSIKYGNKTVIDSFSEKISSNDITCFFGETGSGKSTLCKAIAGWLEPTSGMIEVPSNVQYLPQNPFDSFNPQSTLKKSFGSMLASKDLDIKEFFKSLNLDIELLNRKPSQLSGGELQKFAILRSLLTNPDYLILDEATSMLDVVSQKEIIDFVFSKQKELEFGLIFVTHDKNLCNKLSDKIINF